MKFSKFVEFSESYPHSLYDRHMRKILGQVFKSLYGSLVIELARIRPSDFHIDKLREAHDIQLGTEQLKVIMSAVRKTDSCRLLVFGLGNDSLFWSRINRGGITIFLEDNQEWMDKIIGKSRRIEAFLVKYNTRMEEWRKLLESPSLLEMSLPDEVENQKWDVILVDGPQGWKDYHPGRMKSIYLSAKLIKDSGDIFVHDCEREIEDAYCRRFLEERNMRREIAGGYGVLKHYKMIRPPE